MHISFSRLYIYSKGYFYVIIGNSAGTEVAYLVKVKEDEFLGRLIQKSKIYNTNNEVFVVGVIVIIIILVIIISFFRYRLKKKKKIVIVESGNLKYYDMKESITNEQYLILKILSRTNECSINDLLDVVKNENLHYSHRLRILNDNITTINFKFKILTGREHDIVVSKKSDIDKRIKAFHLNKTVGIFLHIDR